MSKKTSKRAGFAEWQKSLQRQFRNLDPKDPSLWPLVPRLGLYALIGSVLLRFLGTRSFQISRWSWKVNRPRR